MKTVMCFKGQTFVDIRTHLLMANRNIHQIV